MSRNIYVLHAHPHEIYEIKTFKLFKSTKTKIRYNKLG